MAQVKIKKLDPNATIPTSGSAFAAGYDLYACLSGDGEVTIPAHHTVMVPTGIAVALPEGTFGGVFARSGLASREGLRPANCVGVVDSDYRGECFIALHNDAEEPRTVRTGRAHRAARPAALSAHRVRRGRRSARDRARRGRIWLHR